MTTKDKAKGYDKIELEFDPNEGLTITYRDQNYKMTTLQRQMIGDLELHRYKTSQGEEFIHIPKESVIIPPYVTPWYALPPNTRVYLDEKYKQKLLQAAINKAGGRLALRRKLREKGTQMGREYLIGHLHHRVNGIRLDKLIPILTYLQRDLDEPNSHIRAIGTRGAVENPNLPFRLNNINGARIEAARFSDGTLSKSQGRGPRFQYYNRDAEQRNRISESLDYVFGRSNIISGERLDGRVARVRPTTEVIGHALRRSGSITGDVTKQNPDVPTFIQKGSKEMKREWLKQAFGDEGSPDSNHVSVTLSRAVDATHTLSDEQKNRLDEISKGWKIKIFPDGPRKHNRYCCFGGLSDSIQTALMCDRPRLLESEARMLCDDFGIETCSSPSSVCRRVDGGYSVTWTMETTSREGSRIFYEEIGFPQERKQGKLGKALGFAERSSH